MPFIPYATQTIEEDDIQVVADALRSPYLTQGPLVADFEKQVADICGARHAVAVNSGTAALHAACFVAGIQTGNEVITSPITFVASSNAVLYCGGTPVFADVKQDNICIDPLEINKKITSATKAIIPVHFAGHPCDMVAISSIAKEHKLIVIEDAAHALGATYKDDQGNVLKIGSCTHSDMTILSFHAVKHITTGEGGMILTNSKDYYEKLIMFRSHGITKNQYCFITPVHGDWQYEMQSIGFNYRLTDFQCALGISQLQKLSGFLARRREIIASYNKSFGQIENLQLLAEYENVQSAWHIYVIQVANHRKEIFDALRSADLGVNVHYIPVPLQPYYQSLGYLCDDLPNALRYYDQAITLPLYPKMSDLDVAKVIDITKNIVNTYNK